MRRAFTLIELLIVVAIIAILAAIAVPNFLEAQTRSKVSRAQADMRTIATAVESYNIDYNTYVFDADDIPGANLSDPSIWDQRIVFARLTTPIAYLSSFIHDPFNVRTPDANEANSMGIMMTKMLFPGEPPFLYSYNTDTPAGASKPATYGITSLGPNKIFDSWKVQYFPDRRTGMIECTYDPTNGTVSDGDIVRYSKGQP
ncbi:prepilin-type N-terminal cleavage/methylation domain-containing protein [bacterium]|nr:prepilin-type N-terminal cleavage/methylation domain-containing protein [bacterium]